MRTLIEKLLSFVAMLALAGCTTGGFGGADAVDVKKVQASVKPGSPYVVVTATVEYTLASASEAQLSLGLDSDTPGRVRLVADKPIVRGSGTLTLSAEFEKKPDRQLLSAMISIDQKVRGPGHPPLIYRKASLQYPNDVESAPTPAPAPTAAAATPQADARVAPAAPVAQR